MKFEKERKYKKARNKLIIAIITISLY